MLNTARVANGGLFSAQRIFCGPHERTTQVGESPFAPIAGTAARFV